jgi:hypothetical protein
MRSPNRTLLGMKSNWLRGHSSDHVFLIHFHGSSSYLIIIEDNFD